MKKLIVVLVVVLLGIGVFAESKVYAGGADWAYCDNSKNKDKVEIQTLMLKEGEEAITISWDTCSTPIKEGLVSDYIKVGYKVIKREDLIHPIVAVLLNTFGQVLVASSSDNEGYLRFTTTKDLDIILYKAENF